MFSVPVVVGVGRLAGGTGLAGAERKGWDGTGRLGGGGGKRVRQVGQGWAWSVRRKGVAQDR